MINFTVICCSNKVRMRARTSDHKCRILTLKDVKMFGQLEGVDHTYMAGNCERYLMNVLGFEQRTTTMFREIDSVNAILDMANGLVSVYYDVNGVTYYFLGEGIEYEVIEE